MRITRAAVFVILAVLAIAAHATPDIAVYRPFDGQQQARGSTFTFDPVAANAADSRRFEIRNTGNSTLTISNAPSLVSGTCFSQIETPVSSVPPGSSAYVRARILCGTAGTYSGAISISSNDPDENPYTFALSATVTPPPSPEIGIYRAADGAPVASGGSVVFDTVPVTLATSIRFRVENTGSASSDLSVAVTGTCFSLIEAPSPTVASPGSTYFRVRFLCSSAGTFTGRVTVANGDPNENPYIINLSGTATAPSAPDIAVTDNASGAAVPSGGSYAFPTLGPGQADSRLFRITNTGNAPLNITNASAIVTGNCFSLIEAPVTPVAANGGSTAFRVRMLCNTAGPQSGQVSIASDDPDESPYVISLSGQVQGNAAAYVTQSIPASLTAGARYRLSVTMRNTGGTTWTAAGNYRLGILPHGSGPTWGVGDGRIYLASTESVPPGTDKVWTFDVTAPATPGTYTLQWHLVQELVEWFGTPAPQVTVNVTRPVNDAAYVRQSVPPTMTAGRKYAVWVEMNNSGTTEWSEGGRYRLGAPPAPSYPWGVTRLYLGTNERIAPGATKRWAFEVTAPSTPGTYDFTWRLVQENVEWFGALSPAVRVNVVSAPKVTTATPDQMAQGTVTTIDIRGEGLESATVEIATEKPTAETPNRVFPLATLITNAADGRSISVRIDATNPSIEGFYNLVIRNARGYAWVPFRVLPPRPVVDFWTPTEVSGGEASFLLAVGGANLRGATVSIANLPGVTVTDLQNNSDEFLTATVRTTADVTARLGQLVVRGANGLETAVPLAKVAPGAWSVPTENVAALAKDANGQVDAPPLYLQSPDTAGAAATDIGFTCRLNYRRSREWVWRLVILDPDTRRRLEPVLRLVPNIRRRFASEVAVLTLTFTITVSARCNLDGTISDVNACLSAELLTEVPFFGGLYCSVNLCGSTKVRDCDYTPPGGAITSFKLTPNECLTGIDLNTDPSNPSWHPSAGKRYGEVDLEYCCTGRRPMVVSMEGYTESGVHFEVPPIPIFEVESDQNSCPAEEQVDPELKLFLDADNSFTGTFPISDETWVPGSDRSGNSLPVLSMPQEIDVVAAFVDKRTGFVIPPVDRQEAGFVEAKFSLSETTHLDGDAMNYPPQGDLPPGVSPDFSFAGASSIVFDAGGTARVPLYAYDYGGSTLVTAEVGELKATLRIPIDRNNDGIPDAGWFADGQRVSAGAGPNADDDLLPGAISPPSYGLRGDGLAAFEEYRGFVIGGRHTRTSPLKADVFYTVELCEAGTGLKPGECLDFGSAELFRRTGLTVHKVRGEETFEIEPFAIDRGSIVNFYHLNQSDMPALHPYRQAFQQHAVPLLFVAIPGNANLEVVGQTAHCGTCSEIPAGVMWTIVDPAAIEAEGGWVTDSSPAGLAYRSSFYKTIVAHEMGHAVGICHIVPKGDPPDCRTGAHLPDGMDFSVPDPRTTLFSIMQDGWPSWLAQKFNNPAPPVHPPSQYTHDDLKQIRLHDKF